MGTQSVEFFDVSAEVKLNVNESDSPHSPTLYSQITGNTELRISLISSSAFQYPPAALLTFTFLELRPAYICGAHYHLTLRALLLLCARTPA